jgi:hypothetical protein
MLQPPPRFQPNADFSTKRCETLALCVQQRAKE